MSRSIKALSTIEPVTCMVCKKGGFTTENPPVKYLGYTDHLECFAKDFVKKFSKKYPETGTALSLVTPWHIAGVNGIWSALIMWPDADDRDDTHADVLERKTKKQLEEALEEALVKHNDTGMHIIAIFNKGNKVTHETRISVHIVETTSTK